MIPSLPEPEFVIRVRVECKRVGYIDHQSKWSKQDEDEMVFLIPLEGTQRDLMFAKYLQDTTENHTELAAAIGHPVGGLARLALMRRDRRCENHYLFVMTKGAEEDLKNVNGKEIEVRLFSEDFDELLDFQKDFDLANKKSFDA